VTDVLQFGFKHGIGYTDAIFTLISVINNFVDGGCSVYAASLEISEEIDKISHCKLHTSLMAAGLPLGF
jgi:hypothetical protein